MKVKNSLSYTLLTDILHVNCQFMKVKVKWEFFRFCVNWGGEFTVSERPHFGVTPSKAAVKLAPTPAVEVPCPKSLKTVISFAASCFLRIFAPL